MCCLIAVIALTLPRGAMVFIWLFTNGFDRAFHTTLWPLLGFFFMPYTTLAYMAAMLNGGQITGGWLALIIVAAIVDAGHWGGGRRAYRRRRAAAQRN